MPFEYSTGTWETDENGFMRCRARLLSAGVMDYAASELGQFRPPNAKDTDIVPIYVDPGAIDNADTLYSVEGAAVVAGEHEWTDTDNNADIVGNVAGSPRIVGPYLEADLLIRDQETIDKIKKGELSDISAGYTSAYDMSNGNYDGVDYAGQQQQIRFNHIAVLPPNRGRGGREVRVLNSKGKVTMEFEEVRLPSGQIIRVAKQDTAVLNAAVQVYVQNENMAKETMENMKGDYDKMKAENEEYKKKISENEGKMKEMKEQMDNAMSPEKMENAMAEFAKERETATKTLVNTGAFKTENEASESCQGKSGHQLRVHVVNSVRKAGGRDALSDEEAKDESKVSGMLAVMNELVESSPAGDKSNVSGSQIVLNANRNLQKKNDNPFGYQRPAN